MARKASKIRAYVFGDLMTVIARSKDEAIARFTKEKGPENVVPKTTAVKFAY